MSEKIRLAIPTNGTGGLDATRSAHFGHADSFTLVDIDSGEIAGTDVMVNPPHGHGGCGTIVAQLSQVGVRTAIVVGMGQGPLRAMQAHGMSALFDDVSQTPRAAAAAYLTGGLPAFGGDHVCRGH